MAKVQLWGYRCLRCGHEWLPRQEQEPRCCPKCKSPYWDRPRKVTASVAKKGHKDAAESSAAIEPKKR
jgi:DNA-directed RNA polymerase subunit RPC12/RpoP